MIRIIKKYLIMTIVILMLFCTCKKYHASLYVIENLIHFQSLTISLRYYLNDHPHYPEPEVVRKNHTAIHYFPKKILSASSTLEISAIDTLSENDEPYRYYASKDRFIVVGAGPDKKYENLGLYERVVSDDSLSSNVLTPTLYDPTNGTKSIGNMILTSENIGYHMDYIDEKDLYKRVIRTEKGKRDKKNLDKSFE